MKETLAMGKYEPLENLLKTRGVGRWRASFQELEKVLGFKLPQSALKYPAWWSNDETGHSHAKAWLEAGWRTEEVDIPGRKLTFVRSNPVPDGGSPPRDPWGCMAGTVTIMQGTDVTRPSEQWDAESDVS
jgi:hypothetical protein